MADTGLGIAEKDLGKIFEEFHQLKEAHTGNFDGFGLGLNIVKKYLDLMQGDIRVESQPGIGHNFYVYPALFSNGPLICRKHRFRSTITAQTDSSGYLLREQSCVTQTLHHHSRLDTCKSTRLVFGLIRLVSKLYSLPTSTCFFESAQTIGRIRQ